MQLSRITIGFGLAMLLAHAALAQKVTTDYTKGTDFGRYKTFMWIKQPETTNPLTRQRIVDDVNAALTSQGLTLVTSDADLGVAAHAATEKQRTLDTFYNGFGGGWRWGGGFGSATTTVNTFAVGTLVVDIFDGRHEGRAVERHLDQDALQQAGEQRRDTQQGRGQDVQGLPSIKSGSPPQRAPQHGDGQVRTANMETSQSNRWLMAGAGVVMQVALGAVYAWSVFRIPLTTTYGWTISQVTLTFELAILVLGFASFAGGLWMRRVGPRPVAIAAGICYGLGTILAGQADGNICAAVPQPTASWAASDSVSGTSFRSRR